MAVAVVAVVALVAVLVVQTRISDRQRDRATVAEQSLARARTSLESARASATRVREAKARLRTTIAELHDRRAALGARAEALASRVRILRSNLERARADAKNAYQLAYADALARVKARLEQREQALAVRERALDAREQDLAERERALATIEKAKFGDGTWRVGSDIEAGTYRASGGSACYWERLSGFSGSFDQIIANGIGTPHPVVTIAPSDAGFSSQRCGIWTPV